MDAICRNGIYARHCGLVSTLSESEFTVGSNQYRAGRLNARQQFDVARRLRDVLMILGMERGPEFKSTPENFARIVLVSSGNVPQADMDIALNICLGVIKRRMPGDQGWVVIITPTGALMFDDIDMPVMLQLVWHVVNAHRMVDFLSVSVLNSSEPKSIAG